MAKPVICIGASLIDELFHADEAILPATTNMGIAKKTAGGVSRNLAHQLALLNVPVKLVSVFGNDADGDWLKLICTNAGIDISLSVTENIASGKYIGIINPEGSLHTAFFNNVVQNLLLPSYLEKHADELKKAAYLVADTNLAITTIEWIIAFSNQNNIPLIIEPVSVAPARKLSGIDLQGVYLITPNEDELPAICNEKYVSVDEQIDALLERGVQYIWLHKGAEGSALYSKKEILKMHAPKINVVDCTGAGDALVSGFIMGKYFGEEDNASLKIAHTLAAETLQVNGAIGEHINKQKLLQDVLKYYS